MRNIMKLRGQRISVCDPGQAAAILVIPVTTLSRWRNERRELSYVRVGRVIRYRRADLDHWIETHAVPPLKE
ncbi:helix-turn-helix domain-containing protein [Bifidobacterium myosotis]|uniref:helix-turn-helix domain-containing protein n=1 Tax=Bifidobacterium myosotis TaxID=1630166 RepID=UPI000B9A386D